MAPGQARQAILPHAHRRSLLQGPISDVYKLTGRGAACRGNRGTTRPALCSTGAGTRQQSSLAGPQPGWSGCARQPRPGGAPLRAAATAGRRRSSPARQTRRPPPAAHTATNRTFEQSCACRRVRRHRRASAWGEAGRQAGRRVHAPVRAARQGQRGGRRQRGPHEEAALAQDYRRLPGQRAGKCGTLRRAGCHARRAAVRLRIGAVAAAGAVGGHQPAPRFAALARPTTWLLHRLCGSVPARPGAARALHWAQRRGLAQGSRTTGLIQPARSGPCVPHSRHTFTGAAWLGHQRLCIQPVAATDLQPKG